MFDKDTPIVPNMTVRHDVEGLRYRVDDVRPSTTGYEGANQLGGFAIVNYTQLEAGKCPVGSPWSKDETEFRQYFTPDPNAITDIVQEQIDTRLREAGNDLVADVEAILADHDASLPPLIDPITDEPMGNPSDSPDLD